MNEQEELLRIKQKLTGDVKKDTLLLCDEMKKYDKDSPMAYQLQSLLEDIQKKETLKSPSFLSRKEYDSYLIKSKNLIDHRKYEDALLLLGDAEKVVLSSMKEIKSLNQNSNVSFEFFFSEMECSLYQTYYREENQNNFFLPYDYVSLLTLRGQAEFFLDHVDKARECMMQALSYDRVSVDVLFLLADMDFVRGNYFSFLMDLDRLYTFLHKEEDFCRYYSYLAKYYSVYEKNRPLAELLKDLGENKNSVNSLSRKWYLLSNTHKAMLEEHHIPYDVSSLVLDTALSQARRSLLNDNIPQYRYYYQILKAFRDVHQISKLIQEIK